jgi:uncharacterized membrane protein
VIEIMVIMKVSTIMLFVLALRLRLWQKSGTTFVTLLLMFCLLLMQSYMGHVSYVYYHPIVLTVYMFIITIRAVAKERTDKVFGDFHRHDRRKTDVKYNKA